MNSHPYLRAYLAGIFVPTLVLPLILTGFIIVRLVLALPVPIERFVIFPMAVVPSLFGLWNMLYLGAHLRRHVPLGVHGAILPFLGAPTGAFIASCFGMLQFGANGITWFRVVHVPYALLAIFFLAGVAGYYLVWKYVVGLLNRVIGIA
ncbi:MAG TPA: hypothetical protein VH308_08565 [Terracidiphilus sp.]|jgi:hypothetical protein|nr:hypothetical protein [Terracidiphilus sp.]